MFRGPLLFPLFAALAAGLVSCESARFAGARREGSIQSYRAFLTDYPTSKHAPEARRKLEEIVFDQARRADRPIGYHLYLQQYPRGRFAPKARGQLAKLGLKSARNIADLLRVVERYPSTPSGQLAVERLAEQLADEALASEKPVLAKRFLRRFASHPRAAAVREHLAALEYAKLGTGSTRTMLESFAVRHAATKAADRANRRIADLLAAEIQLSADPLLLKQFLLRFPKDPRLLKLSTLVQKSRELEALASVDQRRLKKLAASPKASPDLTVVVRLCEKHPARCKQLRELARRAAPWQPEATLEQLSRSALDADPMAAWRAIARLGNHPDPAAGRLLIEQLGSKRIDIVWISRRALLRWINTLPKTLRSRWLASELRAAPHPDNLDEVQRHGWLQMCFSPLGSSQRDGAHALQRLISSGRSLTAAFLLIGGCNTSGLSRAASPQLVGRLMAAVQARIQWLQSAFPTSLDSSAIPPARMNERELYVLGTIVSQLRPDSSKQVALASISRRISGLLASWREGLERTDASFEPAADVEGPLLAVIAEHQRKRVAALGQLLRQRGRPARAVSSAVCALSTNRKGSSQDKLAERCANLARQEVRR